MTALVEGSLARQEWRAHWPVVLASTAGFSLSYLHFYTLGPFMDPLETEFGWSRSQISLGLTIVSAFVIAFSTVTGSLIDRWGARRFALAGVILYCSCVAMLSLVGPAIWTWWAVWVLLAFTSLGLKPTVWTIAVASKFDSGRGLAIGVALCGSGIASAIFPPISTWLLDTFGWRAAYLSMAAAGAVIVLPLLFLFFSDARDDVRRRGASTSEPTQKKAVLTGLSVRKALLSRRFFQIGFAAFLATFAIIAMTVHFVPIASDSGLSRSEAAAAAAVMGVASIIGRVSTGYLLDRLHGPLVAAIVFSLPIAAVAVLLPLDGSLPLAIVAAIFVGLSLGAEVDLIAYFTSRYFGLLNYGIIFGTFVAVWGASTGTGPLAASMVYDTWGSYDPFLWGLIPVLGIGALLIATVGAYPTFEPEPDK